MFKPSKPDPELEKLRNEIDRPPDLDTTFSQIQKLSYKVHASFLFENEGKAILQKLCLLLSGGSVNASRKIYADWQEFAAHLGLLGEQIRCIDNEFKRLEDPTYYVLLAFVQSREATLDKIFTALKKIERFDIINRIGVSVIDFLGNLLVTYEQTANHEIIQPESIPRAPLVLNPLSQSDVKLTRNFDKLQGVSNPKRENVGRIEPNYGSIVMLTFSDDGSKHAHDMANIFRSMEPKIGVLILNEQEKYLYRRGIDFIDDCFKQVNYIIPVLTKGYIRQINAPVNLYDQEINTLDTKYSKYIYSLLKYEYIKEGCCNKRVRCVIPDSEIMDIVKSNLHPTFQVWFKQSDIIPLAKRILLKNF